MAIQGYWLSTGIRGTAQVDGSAVTTLRFSTCNFFVIFTFSGEFARAFPFPFGFGRGFELAIRDCSADRERTLDAGLDVVVVRERSADREWALDNLLAWVREGFDVAVTERGANVLMSTSGEGCLVTGEELMLDKINKVSGDVEWFDSEGARSLELTALSSSSSEITIGFSLSRIPPSTSKNLTPIVAGRQSRE